MVTTDQYSSLLTISSLLQWSLHIGKLQKAESICKIPLYNL